MKLHVSYQMGLISLNLSDLASCTHVCHVCLSVCLSVREHISRTTSPIFTKFFVHIIYFRGSVLFWRRCDMLCFSGLWTTSCLYRMARNRRRNSDSWICHRDVYSNWPTEGQHRTGGGDWYLRLPCYEQCVCLNYAASNKNNYKQKKI